MTLLAAWNFDEASGAVTDHSGNGRTFTPSGNTVRTASGSGHTAKGLTQSAAALQAGPAITGLNTTSRTMMAWVKLGAAGTYWTLEYHRTAEDTGVWGFLYLSSVFRFRAKNSANAVFEVNITPDSGVWHHLAATHDGTTLKVYRDGVLIGTGVSMAFPVWAADDMRVFDQSGTNVTIDDVRIYDTALTASEISTLMATPVVAAGSSVSGTALSTLPAPVAVASAGRLVLGHAAATLGNPGATAVGSRRVAGAAAGTMPTPVAVASAGRLVLGTAGVTLPAPSAAAVGVRSVRGTAGVTLPAPVAVASAGRLVLGSGSALLPGPVASAAGSVTSPDVAFASAVLPGPVAVASAGRLVLGAALAALSRPSGTSAGQRTVVGTASAALAGAIGTAFSFVTADGDAPWLTLADLMDARATHESIMLDKVRLYRSGRVAQQPFDPELGYEPSNGPAPYYDGKATVQSKAIQTSTRTIAEQSKSSLGYVVKIPVSAIVIAPEDLVEVTESADPRNVGLWLVVEGAETNTFATARRFSCTVWEGAMRS